MSKNQDQSSSVPLFIAILALIFSFYSGYQYGFDGGNNRIKEMKKKHTFELDSQRDSIYKATINVLLNGKP